MQIEKNSLGAFYNITISKGFIGLKRPSYPQLVYPYTKAITEVQPANGMMGNPPTKHQWNKAFEEHLHTEWHNDINDKPSLKYLALPKHLNRQSHQLWHSVFTKIL
jgi:hypothetical protein